MAEFFSFLKMFLLCSTVFFVITLVLLALPQSRLRCVGLELSKWLAAAGLGVLTVLPTDLMPGLPFDDIIYVIGVICAAKSAMGDREKRLIYEEIELQELRAKANGAAPLESNSQD